MVVVTTPPTTTKQQAIVTGEESANEYIPREGLLIVLERNDDKSLLELILCNGQQTYNGSIDVSQVKLPGLPTSDEDPKMNLTQVLLQDGSKHPSILLSFAYDRSTTNISSQDNEPSSFSKSAISSSSSSSNVSFPSMEVTIKHRLAVSGLVKRVYSGRLLLLQEPSTSITNVSSTVSTTTGAHATIGSKRRPTTLSCVQLLGTFVNQAHRQLQQLQENYHTLQQSCHQWKDTALKLDETVWQQEKDQLVQQFLLVYNEAQGRAKQQLAALQEELDLYKKVATTTTTTTTTKTLSKRRNRDYDHEDPLRQGMNSKDEDPISLEVVTSLAAGERVCANQNRRQPIIQPSEMLSNAALKEQAKQYQERKGKVKGSTKRSNEIGSAEESKTVSRKRSKRGIPIPTFNANAHDDTGDNDYPRGGDPKGKEATAIQWNDLPRPKGVSTVTNESDPVGIQETSDDEALRNAIRASVRNTKPQYDEDDSSTDDGV